MNNMANNLKEQQQNRFAAKVSEDINCSICLDILVRPQTLVPCGHSFCRSCFSSGSQCRGGHRNKLSFTNCPQCRQAVEGFVPSRQLESLIETLVTVPNFLFKNDDDKQQYLKRTRKETEIKSKTSLQISDGRRKRQRRNGFQSYPPAQIHASVSNSRTYETLPNNSLISPARLRDLGFGITSDSTATHAAPYDPMLASLPPPFDILPAGSGSASNFADQTSIPSSLSFSSSRVGQTLSIQNFAPPTNSSSVSRSGVGQTVSSVGTSDHCQAEGGARGVSASDPICID